MKTAQQIAEQFVSPQSIKSSKPLLSEKTEKLSQPLIDRLWLKMTEMYGHRWTASFGVSADQSHAWASVLGGITGQQIATGLSALVASAEKWPPTAPEFRAMCIAAPTAESLGLPTEEKAFDEACRKVHPAMTGCKWSHQAVYHAASESGFYNLSTLPMDAARKLFARNYAIACRMVLDGQPLKEIPLALPAKASGPVNIEAGRAALAALRGAL